MIKDMELDNNAVGHRNYKSWNKFQREIDELCGEGEWVVKEYTGASKPVVLEHKCGTEKRLSKGNTFTVMGKRSCHKCDKEHVCGGRPKKTFEELQKEVSESTYDTYEVIELLESGEFIVNHKSCERHPFITTTSRFFSRGQRCQCSKKGVVGRKPNSYTNLDD